MGRVLLEILGVHRAKIVRVFALVFLCIGAIDPFEGVYEPSQAVSKLNARIETSLTFGPKWA